MKEKKTKVFLLTLASILCILLAACVSSGPHGSAGQPDPALDTHSAGDQTDTSGADSTAEDPKPSSDLAELPYTIRIARPDASLYQGPGYDNSFAGCVGTAGVYTVVEEEVDCEGILWGRLKSGAGWVDIAQATAQPEDPAPLWVCFADEDTLSGSCRQFIAEDSPYLVKLLFTPTQVLTDVRLSLLAPGDSSAYQEAETLHTLDEITPQEPLMAGVVFYGDMTAYGLSFTDAHGQARHFAVHISGRNGAPILEEYAP